MEQRVKIVVAGAGSVGCYVGGCLALAGRDVTLLARPRVVEAVTKGLRLTDYQGRDRAVDDKRIAATSDPAGALSGAGVVLLTVKSGQTEEMAELIDSHAPPEALTVSLQNGIDNVERIRAATLKSGRRAVQGMVPFNVLQTAETRLRFHRGTAGALTVTAGHGLRQMLNVDGLPSKEVDDMRPVMWGKLLLNLNNALNALSGRPLADQLSDRDWRRLLAGQMDEALAAMAAAGIAPAALAGAPPALLPTILRLPNWLFRRVARRMLAVDPQARSSMWEDMDRGRATEIDQLQGAILRLGAAHDVKTPLTARIVDAVRAAEAARAGSPGLDAAALQG